VAMTIDVISPQDTLKCITLEKRTTENWIVVKMVKGSDYKLVRKFERKGQFQSIINFSS